MKPLVSSLLFLAICSPLLADTLHVPADHRSIEEAIAAAKAGDTILVAPGTYRETLILKNGITLRSEGDDSPGEVGLKRAEACIIKGTGAEFSSPAVTLEEGSVLDGFTVQLVGEFGEVEFDRNYETRGEQLPDDRGAVGMAENFPAVSVHGVTATVRNNIVSDNGVPGIGCSSEEGKTNNSLIEKNVVFRNMGGGIGISDFASPVVRGNICYRNLRGGIGNRNSRAVIVDNTCFDNVRAGIGIREGATPVVRGNRCYENRRAGIGIRMEGTAPIVEKNECFENGMAGIGCRNGASPVIRENRCYRNRLAGIGLESEVTAVVSKNEIFENGEAGIGHRGNVKSTLQRNHIHHNEAAGIGYEPGNEGTSVVSENRVEENGQVAIGIQAGWTVYLDDNQLSRTGSMPPIVMVFKGATATATGNRIEGSGVAGIRVQGSLTAVKNEFHCPDPRAGGPPQFGIWALPGSNVVARENRFSGWRHAIRADGASVIAEANRATGVSQVGFRLDRPAQPTIVRDNEVEARKGTKAVDVEPAGNSVIGGNTVTPIEP